MRSRIFKLKLQVFITYCTFYVTRFNVSNDQLTGSKSHISLLVLNAMQLRYPFLKLFVFNISIIDNVSLLFVRHNLN